MKTPTFPRASIAPGALLILLGIIVPSDALILFLTGKPIEQAGSLAAGATFFKLGLVLLGLVVVVLGSFPIWQSPVEKQARPTGRDNALLLLGIILVAATALRLYQLNAGLWLDEILTNVQYAKLPFGDILTTFDSENQHFLYSLMAHASFQAFGESIWALRLPAVLFGLLSIWAIYLLGSELAGPREGLLSAALLTFSYQHVWFSQDARGYTGLLFWTILSSWFLVRALRQSEPSLWLGYAVSASLGVYTHITMLFVCAGQFAVYAAALAVRGNKPWVNRWAGLFLGFGLSGLLTLQLYALVLPQVLGGMGRETSLVEAWKDPLWTLLQFVNGMELSFAGGIVAVAAAVVFGAGLLSYARKSPALLGLLFIPPILCAAAVIGLGHHLWPRFFFFAYGFATLVVVRGGVLLGEWAARLVRLNSRQVAWVGTVACIGLIAASAVSVRFAYGPKQDYAGALDFVQKQLKPGDVVVTSGIATFIYHDYLRESWQPVDSLSSLNTIREQAKRTWLIYTFPPVLQSTDPEITTALGQDFVIIKEFDGTVNDGAVFVARADMPPGAGSTASGK